MLLKPAGESRLVSNGVWEGTPFIYERKKYEFTGSLIPLDIMLSDIMQTINLCNQQGL